MLSTNAASAIKGHATANNSMEKDKPKTADLTMGEEPTAAGDFPLRGSVSPINSMIDDKGSITKIFSGGSQSGFENTNTTNRNNYTGRGLVLNSPTFSNGNECGEQSIEDDDLKTSPRIHHLKQVKT